MRSEMSIRGNQSAFMAHCLDLGDGAFDAWHVYGYTIDDVTRKFAMDMFPEQESEIADLATTDEIEAWCKARECYVSVLPIA